MASEPSSRPDRGNAGDAGVPPRRLADNFERAHRVLRAMSARLEAEEAFVAVVDPRGFPACQRLVPRPQDLPAALVLGRHHRCGLAVPGDPKVSLRHLLLTMWPGRGPLRIRGYDLGGRGGVALADGKRVPGFSAHGHVALTIGQSALYVLPGGEPGAMLLDGPSHEAFRRITGIHPSGEGQRLALSAMARPGVAQIGGYRPVDVDLPPRPRGVLTLRDTKVPGAASETRAVEIDDDQLTRGLLIGRYSDRCRLAGPGRNLSRVHALVSEEGAESLLVYDLASTNGVRPDASTDGPSHTVVRLSPERGCMLGHFALAWSPDAAPTLH